MHDADQHARFEALYAEHGEAVLRYARRRTSIAAADDAVADAFTIAWQKLDQAPTEPLGWLLAIARRTLANQSRGERRRVALVERLTREPSVVTHADAPEANDDAVAAALGSLGARDREVLLLMHWDGLTPDEARTALGMTAVAFRSRLHRARRRLVSALEPDRARPPLSPPTPNPNRGS